LTDDQKRFVLETVEKYKSTWETRESEMLSVDRDERVAASKDDVAWLAENAEPLKDEEEKYVEEQEKLLEEEGQPEDDDHKNLMQNEWRLQFLVSIFKEKEEHMERLEKMKKIKVFKYGKFMQALFYLLGFEKDKIVEEGTQKFNWAGCKDLINEEFLNKMTEYKIMGQKESEFKAYQTFNYVDMLLTDITQEQVDEFNMTAGRLFRWLTLAVEQRKADIIRRKALIQKERDERESKMEAKAKRDSDRETQLETAK